jgi:hypothetical protein
MKIILVQVQELAHVLQWAKILYLGTYLVLLTMLFFRRALCTQHAE